MKDVNITWIVLTALASNFVTFFWRFASGYANEKSKNIATKEDIEEITKKVGEVNAAIDRQSELIKARNDFSFRHALAFKQAEREAFLDFVVRLNHWIEAVDLAPTPNFNFENKELIRVNIENITLRQSEFSISRSKLQAFYSEKEFSRLLLQLVKGLINYSSDAKMLLAEIYGTYKIGETETFVGQKSDVEMKIHADLKVRNLIIDYYKTVKEKHIHVYKLHSDLMSLIREQMKALYDPVN